MSEMLSYLPRPPSRRMCRTVFSQGNNRMAQVSFEPRPCRSQSRRSNYSTMLPTLGTLSCADTKAALHYTFVTAYARSKPCFFYLHALANE